MLNNLQDPKINGEKNAEDFVFVVVPNGKLEVNNCKQELKSEVINR